MSVEIIIGRAGSGKTFTCLQKMKNILDNSPLDTKIIFLLPAYQTYRAELALAEITGGAVNTQMCSFQRFSRQILAEVGGAIIPRISEIGERILLRKILLNNSDALKFYKKSSKQYGFAENLAEELKEFRTYSIDAEKLKAVAENLDNDDLSEKISDLALLSENFRNTIKDKLNDESDLLEKAAELIKISDSIRRSEIFIDGFIFFDPQQRKILRELFKYAKNVHITLPMNTEILSNENKNQLGIFNRAFETFNMIKKFTAEIGADLEIIRCENQNRFLSSELEFIEKNLFSRKKNKFVGKAENFKIISAVNRRVEVEAVAQDILKIHREKNFRFREIGIIARDEVYNNLCKNIFEIHNIPLFIDGKRPAVNNPFAELIRSTLEIFHGWRAESIFRAFRTGFFNISPEKIDLLENYVIEFGIRGEKIWIQQEDWRKHKHSLDKPADSEPNDEEKLRLEEINQIRKAILPVINLSKNIKKKISAREFAIHLYNFFEELNIYEKLVEMSEDEEKRGNLALSKENLKIWDDVINLLEQICDSLNEDLINLREFEILINEGLDALEMSIIPPGIDEVTISKFDQNSLQNSRAIYVLGFNDSNFPKKAEEKFLLSDADRLHLNENGLEISKGGRESLLAEKFLIYRGLTTARNYLHVSYTLADSEGKAMQPAAMVEKFKNFFGIENIELKNLNELKNFGSDINLIVEKKNLSKPSAEKLYAPAKKISGSVTKFQDFNSCPFKFFANYGLNLKEREEYKIQVPDIGNILHAVMKNFGEDLKAEKKFWRDVDDKELNNRVEKIVDDLTGNIKNRILLSSSSYKHRRERIKKVAISSLKRLIELDKVSKFHAELFEKNFDKLGGKILSYDIDGVKIELKGIIDRIDFNEDKKYFLIIDYKTGKAYLDLNEIFVGVNLQLITYLAAAKNLDEVGEKIPAAMLYYFLKYPTKRGENLSESEKEIDKDLQMSGWILKDKKIVYEIDESLNFIKVGFNNDGAFKKNSDETLKSSEEFNSLIKYVDEIFKTTCEQILNGDISVEPFQSKKKTACDFCIYSELCGFNPKTDEYKTSNLSDEEIMKKLNIS